MGRKGCVALAGAVAVLAFGVTPARAAPASAPAPKILSAFFGLDDGLPAEAAALCAPAPVLDGMPVVFRSKIAVNTLWPWDFAVITRSGLTLTPLCATTAPANQESEDRTVLVIGELGEHDTDPPVLVKVIGDLRDEAGHSLRGAEARVPPYATGPTLVYAEPAPAGEPDQLTFSPLTPRAIGQFQQNTACPAGTVGQVRVTWDGGTSAPGGAEVGEAQRLAYTVSLTDGRTVTPAALADLGDHDNYHLLCLDTTGTPVQVSAAAGEFAAPHGDVNPATSVAVTQAASTR